MNRTNATTKIAMRTRTTAFAPESLNWWGAYAKAHVFGQGAYVSTSTPFR